MSRLDRALSALRAMDTLAAGQPAQARPDPRARLLSTLLFVLCVVSFGRHEVSAMLPLALYPLLMALQGGVPAGLLWRTVLLASPLALAVGLFNPWLETQPMLELGGVVLSAGWVSLASIGLRTLLTVSATVVLVAGTGLLPLCAALARLGVPQLLVVQLMFMHRYLFVLGDEARRMVTARQLRAGEGRGMELRTYAMLLGHLLLRAFARAQRIHQAMLARGFDGTLPAPSAGRWAAADTLHLLGWAAFFLLVRLLPLPQLLGQWLTAVAAGTSA